MPRLARRSLSAVAGAVAVLALAGTLAPVAGAGPPEPTVPDKIRVPAGHELFLVAHAVGVQIYGCQPAGTGFEWRLVAPRADLYDAKGKRIGTHFGGPTWKLRDGSSVTATRVDFVTVDPIAIDWLLLGAKSTSAGADGDRLAKTAFIQRIRTVSGLPPAAADCDADAAGATAEVPYSADYAFWKKRD